jgi:cytochrome c oxidase subunit 2
MDLLPPALSSIGSKIDSLFFGITAFVIFALFVSWFLLFFPILRFRKNPNPRYIAGNRFQEFRYLAILLAILAVGDFTILFLEHPIWAETQQHIPENAYPIGVVGKQWSWEFIYPGKDRTLRTPDDIIVKTPTLVIPAGVPIRVAFYAEDVLHSFFVPALRFKYDVIPGRTVIRWFVAEREGSYDILCAEICGVLHSRMHAVLKVVSPSEFQRFLEDLEKNRNPSQNSF